jgi:hypothetical protein
MNSMDRPAEPPGDAGPTSPGSFYRRHLAVGIVMLTVVVLAVVPLLLKATGQWPPWPHVHHADLVALRAHAPDVPGGRLYWEDASETGCSWVDCPEARLQRSYLIPCSETTGFTERLGQELERRGFAPPQLLTFFGGETAWRSIVSAPVTHGAIGVEYDTTVGTAQPVSMFSNVPIGEVRAACSLTWTLSLTNPADN